MHVSLGLCWSSIHCKNTIVCSKWRNQRKTDAAAGKEKSELELSLKINGSMCKIDQNCDIINDSDQFQSISLVECFLDVCRNVTENLYIYPSANLNSPNRFFHWETKLTDLSSLFKGTIVIWAIFCKDLEILLWKY